MILENFCIAYIAAQGIDRAMAAHVHHSEDRGASLSSGRKKASPQRVASEQRRIEAKALGVGLDDIGHALVGKPRPDLAALSN
jgi:hypothetical protein